MNAKEVIKMELTNVICKIKKPWYVPGFLWNTVVNNVCDAAKSVCQIDTAADFAAARSMDLLVAAVSDKDPAKREKTCKVIASASSVLDKASTALSDGVVTDEEKTEVGGCVRDLTNAIISQAEIDEFIEGCRKGLLA